MLDKLMRLPIIPEAMPYPMVNENGILIDRGGTSGQQSFGEYLSTKGIDVEQLHDGVEVRVNVFIRQQSNIHHVVGIQAVIDDNTLENLDPGIPEEFLPLFRWHRHVVLAMAGVIGPSIEAIMAYVDRL